MFHGPNDVWQASELCGLRSIFTYRAHIYVVLEGWRSLFGAFEKNGASAKTHKREQNGFQIGNCADGRRI